MQKNILKIVAAMLALSLVLVACSDKKDSDDKKDSKSDTTMVDDTKMTEESMTKSDSDLGSDAMSDDTKSIAAIASGNPEASTAVSLVTKAGLADLLSSEGTITLFAPTNDAFAKVPAETLAALEANPDALLQVLKYHAILTAAVMSSDLTDGQVVETAEGSSFTVNIKDGEVSITTDSGQTANVIVVDVKASNGVIHLIDTVLIPKDLKL